MVMPQVHCVGTPYEIGHDHGSFAKEQVLGSLAFYKDLFVKTCTLDWVKVQAEAAVHAKTMEKICPQYLEELRGLAVGAGVELSDIVALNVRTEIMFSLFTDDTTKPIQTDGCTSIAYKDSENGRSLLAQNWDWYSDQARNLIECRISQPGTDIPDISMITEAGVIGKIGLNAKGVGVCLNAIRARGVDASKLPIHLALRSALESATRQAAIDTLHRTGVAGSGHILVADAQGSTGLECTIAGIMELQMAADGTVCHTNHLLLEHQNVDEPPWLEDSPKRYTRIRQLVGDRLSSSTVDSETLFGFLKDEDGHPCAISRCSTSDSDIQTLFTIVMDLSQSRASVTFGRPTNPTKRIELSFP